MLSHRMNKIPMEGHSLRLRAHNQWQTVATRQMTARKFSMRRSYRVAILRKEERDRAAELVGERVDFRGAPAARTADRLGEFPPFLPEARQ